MTTSAINVLNWIFMPYAIHGQPDSETPAYQLEYYEIWEDGLIYKW